MLTALLSSNIRKKLAFLLFFSSLLCVTRKHSQVLFTKPFVGGLLITGMLGFMMGIVSVNQIRATSPLTHNISGTAKAGVQSALAFKIWGNKATFMACAGDEVLLSAVV